MFCKKCGTRLDDDSLFCENCGTAIKCIAPKPDVANSNESSIPHSEPTPMIVEDVPTQQTIQEDFSAKKKKPKLGIIIFVIAVVIIAIFFVSKIGSGKNDTFYHEINFNNSSDFAYDSNSLYFIAEYDEDDEDTSVYSTDYKGINKKLISDNGDIFRIRVIDGKIYYLESGEDEYYIGVMDINGENQQRIITTENTVSKYAISKNQLFYVTDSILYACDLNGDNNTQLLEDISTFVSAKNKIYFVSNDVISVYDLSSAKSTELCKSSGATDLALDGNTLYFTCDSGLSSINIKGNAAITSVIHDSNLDSYAFFGDYIYYCQKYDTDEIEDLAETLAESELDYLKYKLMLIGTGKFYQADKDGANAHEVNNTDISLVSSLYTAPSDLYYSISLWSNTIEKVEFN